MDPGTSSLKRKRENEYPRVTFNAGPRTFDRLLKESTLDELKDGVRRKLGYPPDAPLHLAQLRGGKAVDLEDEDDFEAFSSAAYSMSVITVQVIEPEDVPRFTPAKSSPLPPNRDASPESPRKRKKKRKLAVDDSTFAHDETTAAHGQKRKTPTPDSDREPSPSKEPEPAPPKKKKKRDVPSNPPNESTPTEDVVAEKAPAVDKSTGEEPTEKEKEKAADKEKKAVDKAKKAAEKQREKKEKVAEAPAKKERQSKSKKDKSIPQVDADADVEPTGNATLGEDVAEKPKKKKKAAKDKASGDKGAQGEGSERPEADAGAAGATDKGDKVKKTPKNKNAERVGNEKDASDKTPAVPQRVTNDEGSDNDEEPDSSKEKKKTPAKTSIVTGEKAAAAKKTTKGKETVENGQHQDEPPTTGTGGAAEKPTELKEASKKPSDTAVCPICGRAPTHTQSRCNIYRAGLAPNLKFLRDLEDKQAEDPTDFRARQIQLVEGIITRKQNKAAQNGKVVSDVVVGVAANSSTKSAKSARPKQSEISESAQTARPAPKAPTLPSSKPPKENTQNAHVSQPSASTECTTEQRKTQPSSGTSSGKSKLPIPRPPDVQQSKKDPKTTARRTVPQPQATFTVPVELSSSTDVDGELSDETPTPTTTKTAPPPPTQQRFTIPVKSGSSSDRSTDEDASPLPKPESAANQDSSSSSPSSSHSSSPSSEEEEDEGSDSEIPARLPPPPGSNFLANLSSLTDADLDAVIRGPNVSITSKNLPLSDSSDEDDEKDTEDLVQDSEEEIGPRRRSNASKAAQLSSDDDEEEEEDSDSDDRESEQSEEDQTSHGGRQPPRLSVDTKLQTDESSPSTAVEHGNLSFGAANELASSVEIDSRGDRAFSEAFADDTAVFKLAAAEPEDSGSADESDRPQATPKGNKAKTKLTTNDDRHDSIEPFESPEKPKSPIIQQDFLLSTPRGLTQRMKDRRGKTPTPASSMQKAIRLFDSATKLVNASARTTALKLPIQSQKAGPVTSTPANQRPPPHTTRSKANDQSQASDITLNAEETPESVNNWEVLQPEESFGEETMNMEDELQSDPLFIPGETQNSFPYSQWQQPPAVSPNDSDDEDEVENAITARPPSASQTPSFAYKGLSQIASQRRTFHRSLPAAPRLTDKKDTMVELYGHAREEPSDESGSDSDSDSDAEKKPNQKSHIPKSRRAGVRSKA